MNEIYSIIAVILQSRFPKNHLEQLNILMLPTESLGMWECTEGSMADRHRLASHPWIYTQHLSGLIHWNLNEREIEELTAIIIIIILMRNISYIIIKFLKSIFFKGLHWIANSKLYSYLKKKKNPDKQQSIYEI